MTLSYSFVNSSCWSVVIVGDWLAVAGGVGYI